MSLYIKKQYGFLLRNDDLYSIYAFQALDFLNNLFNISQ